MLLLSSLAAVAALAALASAGREEDTLARLQTLAKQWKSERRIWSGEDGIPEEQLQASTMPPRRAQFVGLDEMLDDIDRKYLDWGDSEKKADDHDGDDDEEDGSGSGADSDEEEDDVTVAVPSKSDDGGVGGIEFAPDFGNPYADTTTTASPPTPTPTPRWWKYRAKSTASPRQRFYDHHRGRYYPTNSFDCYSEELTSRMDLQDYVYGATGNDFLLCREIFLFQAEPMKPPKLPVYVPEKYSDCRDPDLLARMDFRTTRFRVSAYLVPLDQKGRCTLYVEENRLMKPRSSPGRNNSSYVFLFGALISVVVVLLMCRSCCKRKAEATARADFEAAAGSAGFGAPTPRVAALHSGNGGNDSGGAGYAYRDLGWFYRGHVDSTNMDSVAAGSDLAPSYEEALAAKMLEERAAGGPPSPSPPPSYHAALREEEQARNPAGLPRPEC